MDSHATIDTRTGRLHNFGAGPAVLPEPVLEQVRGADEEQIPVALAGEPVED